MKYSKPVSLSASSCMRYLRCPYLFYLIYIEGTQRSFQNNDRFFISKAVHSLGNQWALSTEHGDTKSLVDNYIYSNVENIAQEDFNRYSRTIEDLLYKYIELLKRLNMSNFTFEETYGTSLKKYIQITDQWSFSGAADLVIYSDKTGDSIYDAKWTWNTDEINTVQIKIYATVHEKILKRPVRKIGFICFGPQKIIEYQFDDLVKKDLLNLINKISSKILNKVFPPNPSFEKCFYCELADYCRFKKTNITEQL